MATEEGTLTLNRELLGRVRDFITAEPDRFDIVAWFDSDAGEIKESYESFAAGDCGTTACIAGTAVVLAGCVPKDLSGFKTSVSAMNALGLSGSFLFHRSSWPEAYSYDDDMTGRKGAIELMDDMLAGTVKLDGDECGLTVDAFAFWRSFAPVEVSA
jgi:hypothetical protein